MSWSVRVGEFLDRPVYAHVTLLLGVLYFVGEYGPLYGVMVTVFFYGLMLVHEMGHAVMAVAYGNQLDSIRLFPIHGECRYMDTGNPDGRFPIAAAGILAQLCVLVTWLFVRGSLLPYQHATTNFLWLFDPASRMLVDYNIGIMIFNALPIPGLDGAVMWREGPAWMDRHVPGWNRWLPARYVEEKREDAPRRKRR